MNDDWAAKGHASFITSINERPVLEVSISPYTSAIWAITSLLIWTNERRGNLGLRSAKVD